MSSVPPSADNVADRQPPQHVLTGHSPPPRLDVLEVAEQVVHLGIRTDEGPSAHACSLPLRPHPNLNRGARSQQLGDAKYRICGTHPDTCNRRDAAARSGSRRGPACEAASSEAANAARPRSGTRLGELRVAQTVHASLGLVPDNTLAFGVAVEGPKLRVVFQLQRLDEQDQADMNEIECGHLKWPRCGRADSS